MESNKFIAEQVIKPPVVISLFLIIQKTLFKKVMYRNFYAISSGIAI